MQQTHQERRAIRPRNALERLAQLGVRLGGVGEVQCLAFFNQRAHPVDLAPLAQLRANALNHLVAPGVVDHLGDDGGAPGRQLVNGGDIQVRVVAHGQGTGNGGGRHHQQMRLQRDRWLAVNRQPTAHIQVPICLVWPGLNVRGRMVQMELAAQGQALGDAKAVLLINDRQCQFVKRHLVLNEGVGAHHQPGLATGNQRQHLAARLGFLTAGEPGRGDAQRLQPAHQLGKVLGRQNLGRRHQGALPARIDADGRCQRRHHGFARAHIALQQAVHGHVAGEVEGNFLAHPALGCRQGKGECCQQLLMQGQADRRRRLKLLQHRAWRLAGLWAARSQHGGAQARALALGLQLRQLLRQQLLGLEPLPGRMAVILQRGQRNVWRRVMQK